MLKFMIGVAFISGCVTNPERTTSFTLNTSDGKPVRLGSAWQINDDCTLSGVPEVTVIDPPKNGKVTVQRKMISPDSRNEKLRQCNKITMPGSVSYYRSSKGFKGVDRMTLRVLYIKGNIDYGNITVNVD